MVASNLEGSSENEPWLLAREPTTIPFSTEALKANLLGL